MRRVVPFALFALLWAAGPVPATDSPPMASGYTAPDAPFRAGMWWNPDLDGSGMDIHLSGERLFLVWYTYEGNGLPVWYLAEGDFSGDSWNAPLQRFTWDAASGTASSTPVGEVTLTFDGTASAEFAWTLGEATGSYAIQPLLVSEGISVYDRTGHWYPPGEPGFGLTVNNQGSVEFVVAYLYDAEGEPRWVWADRTGELTRTHELVMFEGACPACDYEEPVPTAAGSLTREFTGLRTGTLTLDVNLPEPSSGAWERTGIEINLLSNPQDGRSHPAAMATFASPEALEVYLKRALAERPPYHETPIDLSPAPPRFSQTTVQEQGVDEADSIKTDGRVLYAIDRVGDDAGIRVLELEPESAGVSELARIPAASEDLALRDLYLAKGDGGQAPDLLVGILHNELVSFFGPPWHNPSSWAGQAVELRVWDVTVPSSPELVSSIGVDGGLVETRRIGDTLYLVSRYAPQIPEGVNVNPRNPEEVAANLAILDDLSLEDLLPDLRIDGEKVGELVDPADTWLPPVLLDRETPNMVSVSAIDLRAPEPSVKVLTVVGQSEAIYVSPENLYLASTRYAYSAGQTNMVQDYPQLIHTDLHKLSLAADGPSYRGSASVEGHLGHHQDRKSFRMGEHKGMLGVVTSADEMWGNLGDHRLTMLQETPRTSEHRLLREAAHLPNPDRPRTLGKPGEALYATRFLDERLYVVTFRQIDPLYVVDLADPREPRIAGEVEVTGYSDFLYPVGDDMLLGIGRDAVPTEEFGDGRFAWYQGLKLALFDVTDPADPVEIDSLVIGRRGTTSPALADHHAFSFLPEGHGLPARFAVPVAEHDAWTQDDISPEPNHHYPWVRTGLYLFNVLDGDFHPRGLMHSGTIVTSSRAPGSDGEHDPYLPTEFSRSVIMDDSVYFVKDGEVWGAKWRQPNQAVGPQ